jgi:hypothetical protein
METTSAPTRPPSSVSQIAFRLFHPWKGWGGGNVAAPSELERARREEETAFRQEG